MSEPVFIDRQALFALFLAESAERLDEVEEALIRLETQPGDEDLLHTVFRGMHTLKGDANTVGLLHLGELAHHAEDLLDQIRTGERLLTAREASLLLGVVDTSRTVLAAVASGDPGEPPELAALTATLAGAVRGEGAEAEAVPRTGPEAPVEAGGESQRTLRIPVAKLDRLLDLAGQIAIAREQLRQTLAATGPEAGRALTALEEADPLYLELQELVMNARLLPIGPTLRQQLRIVRDITTAQGKAARMMVDDHGVEVDTKVIEHLRAPLAHLVRNAVDHGLETPAERRTLGKDPIGTVRLSARQESGTVVIEVADDGAGLARDRIAARAAAQGLLAEGKGLSDREAARLLFRAGFSTAETVSEVSGRGVGLDIVQKGVEALHGTVDIDSQPRRGTTVSIRVPLTLAIIEGFVVGVGAEAYILPLETILECSDLAADQAAPDALHGVLYLRGGALPFLRLSRFFGVPMDAPPGRESVVVVRWGEEEAGLVVDQLYGSAQTVVKALPPGLSARSGFSGTAVLGNGRVAMILDVMGLLARLLAERAAVLAEIDALA